MHKVWCFAFALFPLTVLFSWKWPKWGQNLFWSVQFFFCSLLAGQCLPTVEFDRQFWMPKPGGSYHLLLQCPFLLVAAMNRWECVGFVAVSFKMVSRLGSGNGQVSVSLDRKGEMHIAGLVSRIHFPVPIYFSLDGCCCLSVVGTWCRISFFKPGLVFYVLTEKSKVRARRIKSSAAVLCWSFWGHWVFWQFV